MSDAESRKYGQMRVERGGVDHRGRRRSMIRTAAEIALDERMRRRFARLVTPAGTVPSRAIQEIREGRQAPWRATARRVLEMMDAGVSTVEIKAVVLGETEEWIDELAAHRRLDPAA